MPWKILVADDEEVVRTVIRRALSGGDYEILSAKDGAEALRMARETRPALVLLDVNMPVMDGREVLKALRRDINTQSVPILLVTGHIDTRDKIVGLEMGADDYITKPFEVAELKARVESVLRRHRRDLSTNPLTRLPGSPVVEEEVNRRLREKKPFAFFYVDIDNFKSYNDAYGYGHGDQVIQETAGVLLEALRGAGADDAFVGHIGGDDFVLVARPEQAEALAAALARSFDARAPLFYQAADRERGHILGRDRGGKARTFPLLSLSIAVTGTHRRHLDHYGRVVDIVTEIKRHLKSRAPAGGSRYLIDRRGDPSPGPTAP